MSADLRGDAPLPAGRADEPLPDAKWPRLSEACYVLGILATIIAALLYMAAVWYLLADGRPTGEREKTVINISAPRGLVGHAGSVGSRSRWWPPD
jgi:hypothetical protein